MHISNLNEVAKISGELSNVRAQLHALDSKNANATAHLSGRALTLSDRTLETITKLALIDLLEQETALVERLENLGVDAEELPACECGECAALFGGSPRVSFADGGVVGRRG